MAFVAKGHAMLRNWRHCVFVLVAGALFALLAGCSSAPEKKINPDDAKSQWKKINEEGRKERGI